MRSRCICRVFLCGVPCASRRHGDRVAGSHSIALSYGRKTACKLNPFRESGWQALGRFLMLCSSKPWPCQPHSSWVICNVWKLEQRRGMPMILVVSGLSSCRCGVSMFLPSQPQQSLVELVWSRRQGPAWMFSSLNWLLLVRPLSVGPPNFNAHVHARGPRAREE